MTDSKPQMEQPPVRGWAAYCAAARLERSSPETCGLGSAMAASKDDDVADYR